LEDTVRETIVLRDTASNAREVLLGRPSVHRELVLVVVVGQLDGRTVDTVSVLIEKRVAGTAPSIERAVHVNGVEVTQGVLAHVDIEGHIVEARAVIVAGSCIIVGGRVVRATGRTTIATGEAGSPAHHAQIHGVIAQNVEVTVRESSSRADAGANRVVSGSEVLLISPRIHLELVGLVLSGRNEEGTGPDAVSILVGQLVAIAAEAIPVSGHVHETERSSVVVHVDREGDQRAVVLRSTTRLTCAPCVHDVAGTDGPEAVGIAEVVRDRHTIRVQEIVVSVAIQVRTEVEKVLLLTIDEPLVFHVRVRSGREDHLIEAFTVEGSLRPPIRIPSPERSEDPDAGDVGQTAAGNIKGCSQITASTAGGTAVEAHHVEGLIGTAAVVRTIEAANAVVHTATTGSEISRLTSNFGARSIRIGVSVEELVGDSRRT